MAHSLASPPPQPPPATATTTKNKSCFQSCVGFQKVRACYLQVSDGANTNANAHDRNNRLVINSRRSLGLGLAGALISFNVSDPSPIANAAARRPPPPPAEEKEKKDPNVSGVLAKVLASKKRKESMKEFVAKLREKGKLIEQPSQSQP
ncbi:uncharacterized protein Pyn_01435 [Prunus yedoensis var. nudiflora]|uniref:Uncharacterized protein n=1 Tax=Prunus yedoensis var. nudiflora TaxID=2094558 RepID=A0A314YAK3_PRUYE|nr:uncharacterized protein Pyn_01435 [Prunus yedoensis var. nudiflora]